SRMNDFMQWLENNKNLRFGDYSALWQWSVDELEEFWASIWEYFDIRHSVSYDRVLDRHDMPGANWFEGSKLNLSEQLFRFHEDDLDRPAIVSRSELRPLEEMSWRELSRHITAMAHRLREMGLGTGASVVDYLQNSHDKVVACYV